MRREKTVIVDDRGRELQFTVREMPATRLESWIVRAGLLLAGAGVGPRPPGKGAGEAGGVGEGRGADLLAALGRVDYDRARPLLDELLACCTPAGSVAPLTPATADGVIEDVRTLLTLRREALALNFAFFAAAGPSGSADGETPSPASRSRSISVRSRD